ncbi:hypothetical protein Q73A0000_13595 [Kaistella flava (ex Peng et al. 2021)]|uniref:Tetratricopeptide repeat protein n=1 Tax=Kaistella flava (ex Peng et al. 2021) TaxID=2038776 RepID=A0A7M2YAL7_9FLAO|nr:hypothetical protein [Kaistella flava (ex Peng et al. 2021)]QOW11317.1 hypothetical protein Q73A0000_13595 [Kaistella flava (ex Peng et al. 2021)]
MRPLFNLLCCFLLCLSIPLSSQVKNDKSEIKRANDILYENPNESIKIASALLKNEKNTDKVANLYMMISTAYIAKRDIDSSLYFIMKTTNLINSDALLKTKIRILNTVSVQYQQMQLYDKSLETLDKAKEFYLKLPPNDKSRNYNFEFNNMIRGMIYRSQSNPEMALEKFSQAVEYFKKLPQTKANSSNISVILYNMGYCYMELNQNSKGKFYFTEAIKYGHLADAKSIEAYALKGLSENLYVNHEYTESLGLLDKADHLAKSIGDLVLNEGIYKLMANNYLAINNWGKYQFYSDEVLKLKQEKEKKDQKSLNRYIKIQSSENQEKTNNAITKFNIYQLLILGFSLLAILFLVRSFLSNKKGNKLLKNNIEQLINSDQ